MFLGIDTSNYKTSVAITNEKGEEQFFNSKLLSIKKGEKGLRQSLAFWKHSEAIPVFLEEAFFHVNPKSILAVSVSITPRNMADSYMPVFMAGYRAAQIIKSSLQVPIFTFSHQEGHIESIISYNTSGIISDEGIAFHLSGGTTEIIYFKRNNLGFETKIIGGTKDISIGQLLDRIGVLLGIEFPAGEKLDGLALKENPAHTFNKKIKIDNGYFNLSGIENHFMLEIKNGNTKIANDILGIISDLIEREVVFCNNKYNNLPIYMVGGVSGSNYLRMRLSKYRNIIFGPKKYSGDNAIGIANLGRRRYFFENNNIGDK